MENRLVFSSNNIVYEWDKYNAITNYQWDKYSINTSYLYEWDKYSTIGSTEVYYYWNKYYTQLSTTYYSFNKELVSPIQCYLWGKYTIVSETIITAIRYGNVTTEYAGGFGNQSITLYEKPDTSSPQITYYNGEDYDYDNELFPDYIYYLDGDTWKAVNKVWMGGSGTQVEWQSVRLQETTTESQGTFIGNVSAQTETAYPNNGIKDGYWYLYIGGDSSTYYSGNAQRGAFAFVGDFHKASTLPTINRATGEYTFIEDASATIPCIYYDSGTNYYYQVTTDTQTSTDGLSNAIKISSDVFDSGTVFEYKDYIGVSALNDSYLQLVKSSEYIKGTFIEQISSTDRYAYNDNGIKGDYWYVYDHSSSSTGYIWKKYNLNTESKTFYHWNYYLPKYKWKRYNYTTRHISNPLSTNQILLYKVVPSSDYGSTIARVQFNEADMNPYVSIDINFTVQNPAANRLYPNGSAIVELRNTYTNGYITLRNIVPAAANLINQNTVYLDNATNIKLYMDNSLNIYIYGKLVSQKGSFIDYVYSNDRNTYPNDGVQDDYYYEYDNQEQGDYVGQVTSEDENAYEEGFSGVYYYESMPSTSQITYTKGSYITEVTSVNRDAYPNNDKQGDYWYVYDRNESSLEKGEFIENVYSNNSTEYPNDGVADDNYWYTLRGNTPQYSKGDLIGQISSTNIDAYPNNDRLNNNWYVSVNPFYTKGNQEFGYVQSYSIDAYPQNGEYGGYWYEYVGTSHLTLDTLYDSDLYGGVKFTQDISASNELMFGISGGSSITFDMDNATDRTSYYLGASVNYYVKYMNDLDETFIGTFIVTEVHKNRDRATITALDVVSKFDIEVDDWINNISNGITLTQLCDSLSDRIGVPILIDETVVNKNEVVGHNYSGGSITGRVVLRHIAELAGGFVIADKAGNVIITTYKNKDINLDNSQYKKLTIADYVVSPITKINVANVLSDGSNVIVGSGDNTYLIDSNALFIDNKSSIQRCANNLLSLIGQFTYTPTTISLIKDYGINCGDIINVNGISTFVQSKTIDKTGVVISCTGTEHRNPQYNEINTKLNNINGQINNISDDVDNLSNEISDASNAVSRIEQKVNNIRLSVTEGNDSSYIELKSGGISLGGGAIDLSGKVSFGDLSTQGQTIINGDNIQTGIISADRISLNSLNFDKLDLTKSFNQYTANIGSIQGHNGISPTTGLGMFVSDPTLNVGQILATPNGAKLSYDSFTGWDNEVSVYASGTRMAYGINNGTPVHYLEVSNTGNYSDGHIIATSDKHKKKDINYNLDKYENFYKCLKPSHYKIIGGESGREHIGFIAQDVKKAIEENDISTQEFAGYCEWDDTCGLRYEEFIALNTSMIQKLLNKIEILENRINELEAKQ